MTARINQLDTSLSAHICASQVIEDLPSAVKEMIENALVLSDVELISLYRDLDKMSSL